MPIPIYDAQDLKVSFHLRYTWTRWPTEGTKLPIQPDDLFFQELDDAWATDNLNRISMRWNDDNIQIAFSTMPNVSPTFFVARVKGRLQHALRLAETPVKFSRKVGFRSIGDNHSSEVEGYIARQVDKEQFVDPRFAAMLKRFTVIDERVALDQPSESNSGRYWYNLHLTKHNYELAARAWLPDHVHMAPRGNIA